MPDPFTAPIRVKLAGFHDGDVIEFDPRIQRCGDINDGVSFNLGDGWFVMSFKDLQRITLAAEKIRNA